MAGVYYQPGFGAFGDVCDSIFPQGLPARGALVGFCRQAVSSAEQLESQAQGLATSLQHDLDAANLALSALRQQLNDSISTGKTLAEAIAVIDPWFDRAPTGIPQMLNWLSLYAGGFAALLENPDMPADLRMQYIRALMPPGVSGTDSDLYHLIMDPQYQDAADMLAIFLFWPLIVLSSAGSAGIVPNLNVMDHPTPYLQVLRDAMRVFVGGATGADLVRTLTDLGKNLIEVCWGVKIGPATAAVIAVYLITNLPQVPYGSIAIAVANDPVFQDNLKHKTVAGQSLPPWVVDTLVPSLVPCLQISDADLFLKCAQGAIDVTLPGLVQRLRDHGVSLTDVRVVVSALWRSGANPTIAFDRDRNPGALESLLALGVAGMVEINDLLHVDQTIEAFIRDVVGSTADPIFAKFNKLISYFKLLMGVYADERDIGQAVRFPKPGLADVIQDFNEARWALDVGLSLAHSRGRFQRFLAVGANGKYIITPNLHALLIQIRSDPDLQQIAWIFCDLFDAAGMSTSFCPSPGNTVIAGPKAQQSSGWGWLLAAAAALAITSR